jgi:hypothetical protein
MFYTKPIDATSQLVLACWRLTQRGKEFVKNKKRSPTMIITHAHVALAGVCRQLQVYVFHLSSKNLLPISEGKSD